MHLKHLPLAFALTCSIALAQSFTPIREQKNLSPAAIAKLQIEQRQVILLVGLEGMDYEGTAKILNVPIGTVRSRLSRGRSELRKLMGYIEGPENAPAEAQEYCVQKRAA